MRLMRNPNCTFAIPVATVRRSSLSVLGGCACLTAAPSDRSHLHIQLSEPFLVQHLREIVHRESCLYLLLRSLLIEICGSHENRSRCLRLSLDQREKAHQQWAQKVVQAAARYEAVDRTVESRHGCHGQGVSIVKSPNQPS